MSEMDLFLDELRSYRNYVVVGVVGVIVLTVLFLPAVQSILYGMFVASPGFVQWAFVAVLIAVVGVVRGSSRLLMGAGVFFFVMALIVGPLAGGVYAHTDMANQMQSEATQLESLPNTSQESVRVLPRQVADNYASSSMQKPQYRLTGSDIAYRNGTYTWSYGLAPDNFMVSLTGQQTGAMYINMETINKETTITDTDFKNGRGQLWFDSYTYQSVLQNPFVDHRWSTTFNAEQDGTEYIAHSTVGYTWKFKLFPIPQLYAVPTHAGVDVMYPDGEIKSYTPSEATKLELLEGQNYYPYGITMFKVNSMKYKHGVINKWFYKEDVLAVADLPEGGNTWPLAVPIETDDSSPELTYFVATEPTGSGNGVYEVWTFDSQTGAASVQQYNNSQIGPQKAIDFVERQPNVNRLSNAQAISPIPIVKQETLYWHVKVIPKSESGVIYTAFVNAKSGDVTLLEGTEPIYAFLTQEEVTAIKNNTTEKRDGMTVTVVVTDSTGAIQKTTNITIPDGGGANIKIKNENETRTQNNASRTRP